MEWIIEHSEYSLVLCAAFLEYLKYLSITPFSITTTFAKNLGSNWNTKQENPSCLRQDGKWEYKASSHHLSEDWGAEEFFTTSPDRRLWWRRQKWPEWSGVWSKWSYRCYTGALVRVFFFFFYRTMQNDLQILQFSRLNKNAYFLIYFL